MQQDMQQDDLIRQINLTDGAISVTLVSTAIDENMEYLTSKAVSLIQQVKKTNGNVSNEGFE